MNFGRGKPFAVRGEFGGFFENAEGKRRMLLRIDGSEVAFKLPRELRRKYGDRLEVGQTLEIEGTECRDLFSGREKRVIEHLHILRDAVLTGPCASCTIRVCTKKNCWHSGGKALWHFLEEKIATAGLNDVVRLEAIRCLDQCKHAPVIEARGRDYRDCDRETAGRLIDSLAAGRPA